MFRLYYLVFMEEVKLCSKHGIYLEQWQFCESGRAFDEESVKYSLICFSTRMNMHTPKGRPSSLGVSKKTSTATPGMARKLKTQGSDSELIISTASKTVKDRSPKVMEHCSPRSPAIKKKCPLGVSELESQLARLQNELKKTKDQLGSSESLKHKAQLEADEVRKHLAAMSKKLKDTQKQLEEISDSEEARLQELRKISQDRDRAWQSELEAVQKQNSMDSAALASAINEVQRLRVQLDLVAESEAAQASCADSSQAEVDNLRMELTETLSLVEESKSQLTESKESGVKALEEISKAQMQLELAKITEGTLQSEILKATNAYKSLAFELEQSQNRASKLELQKVESNTDEASVDASNKSNEDGESDKLKAEISSLKVETEQLRSGLEAAERRASEQEALAKRGHMAEEAAAEELRRLKVQVEQWRKAAEAAASMLLTANNDNYDQTSPYFEDTDDDDEPKKKNVNMLRKIGTLLKKI